MDWKLLFIAFIQVLGILLGVIGSIVGLAVLIQNITPQVMWLILVIVLPLFVFSFLVAIRYTFLKENRK